MSKVGYGVQIISLQREGIRCCCWVRWKDEAQTVLMEKKKEKKGEFFPFYHLVQIYPQFWYLFIHLELNIDRFWMFIRRAVATTWYDLVGWGVCRFASIKEISKIAGGFAIFSFFLLFFDFFVFPVHGWNGAKYGHFWADWFVSDRWHMQGDAQKK